MAVGFQTNLVVTINGVPANIPVSIGVSIGEPKIVMQPQSNQWERQFYCQPPQILIDPNQRVCSRCGVEYVETLSQWPQYAVCRNCNSIEEEQRMLEYQREISEPRRPVLRSYNDVNNVSVNEDAFVDWKKEGF